MDILVHQLGRDSNDEIMALVGARRALLVSFVKFDTLPPNADYLTVHDFHVASWRRDVNPLDYDLAVFKLQAVCTAMQFSFHTHQYRKVHVFVDRMETAGLLRCEAVPRCRAIYINTDLLVPEQRRTCGGAPDDALCVQDIRYRYIRKYMCEKVAIFSSTRRVFEDFPGAVDADALGDRSGYTCIVYDFRDGTDYGGFKETIFFVSEQEDEEGGGRGCCTSEKIVALGGVSQKFAGFLRADTVCVGEARLPRANAQQLLLSIVNEIRGKLEEIGLFVRDNDFTVDHGPEDTVLRFPFFDFQARSSFFIRKKERTNDCCLKAIVHLHENGVLDDFLHVRGDTLHGSETTQALLRRAYGTADRQAIEEIKNRYFRCEEHRCRDELVEREGRLVHSAEDALRQRHGQFKRAYGVSLRAAESPAGGAAGKTRVEQIEEKHRKLPDSLQQAGDVFSLYVFSSGCTGILCAESFGSYSSVDRLGRPVEVRASGRHRLSDTQLQLVKFYQILFFMVHKSLYRSSSQAVQYHYYAVPVADGARIDWGYLGQVHDSFILGSVADTPCVGDRLVWNPFTRKFLVHAGDYARSIEESFGEQTFLEHFESSYRVSLLRRTGPMIFRGLPVDRVAAAWKKTLLHRRDARGTDGAADSPVASVIASKEACFVTSVRKAIVEESILFVSNFFMFESVCIAHELNRFLRLELPLGLLTQALTHSRDNEHCNYERLEFLGDCVLKYTVTNYLCLRGLPLGSIAALKDSLISNDNLHSAVFRTGLFRFVSTMASYHKMFQAPHVDGLEQFKRYFGVHQVFSSDNLGSYLDGVEASGPDLDKKVYADIFEAIVGSLMVVGGLEAAMRFLYRTGIIRADGTDPEDGPPGAAEDFDRLFVTGIFPYVSGLRMEYAGVLGEHEILEAQRIINYDFRARGLLERALAHPSFADNVFGSQDFQMLEMIGDSALDLFVVRRLYLDPSLSTPLHLHSAKKSYVNNRSLGMIVVRTDLLRCLRVGDGLDASGGRRVPKAFSDIFEAILGAILCDVNWDFERFAHVVANGVWKLLEAFRAETEA